MIDRIRYTGIFRYALIVKVDLAVCVQSNILKKSISLDRIVDIRLRLFIKIDNLRIASAFLDAYEEARATNGERDARHTITHVCAITDEDIQRMADLDVVANLQFLMMYHDALMDLERAYIGDERAMAMYPVKHLAEAGICISGSSDAPVIPFVPLDAIEAGVTRNSPYPGEEDTDMTRWPEQGLTAYQVLEACTKNNAYQNFMDDIIGTVEVGKFADLVVLDTNILEVDAKAISDTRVIYTISDGRIVYEG